MTRYGRLLAVLFLFPAAALAAEQSKEEAELGKKLYVENLRLAKPSDFFQQARLNLAYVSEDTKPGGGKYFCGAIAKDRLKSAATELEAGFKRIPIAAWRKIDMKTVLLCSTTKAGDREIGGIPIPPLKLLMLASGREAGGRFAHTALHELYHLMEMQAKVYSDKVWDDYFKGYKNAYSSNNSVSYGSGGEGFLNAYSTSFSHEERAEIFAGLMLSQKELIDHIRQTQDRSLMQKVGFVISKCRQFLDEEACKFDDKQ